CASAAAQPGKSVITVSWFAGNDGSTTHAISQSTSSALPSTGSSECCCAQSCSACCDAVSGSRPVTRLKISRKENCWMDAGESSSCNNATLSSISCCNEKSVRYHSSRVNSGLCFLPASPSRNTLLIW